MFVSADGKRVVVVDNRGVVTIHDPAQAEPIKKLEGFAGYVEVVEFSSDGKLLLLAMHDKTLLCNLESGESTDIPKRESYHPRTATFSPDSKEVYLAYPSHGIDKFNIATSQSTKFCDEEEFSINMTVAADGSKLYVCVRDDVKTWDTKTGKLVKSVNLDRGSRNSYVDMKLSSSGIGLYQGSKTTDVYRLDKATKFTEIPERSRGECCSITNDGKTAAVAGSSGADVVVWDIQGKKSIDRFPVDTISVNAIALSPNGRFLLTVGYDKVIQLWERKEDAAKATE
jgi:WD40 repeat protein